MATDTNQFFDPWETTVKDWADFQTFLPTFHQTTLERGMVWRGVANAGWALHSSLARMILDAGGDLTEQHQADCEAMHLEAARNRWRFDNLSGLEILAQLQHYGAPTRLLDVSFNPLIALWFACEAQRNDDDKADGRLFAFEASNVMENRTSMSAGGDLPWQNTVGAPTGVGETLVWRPAGYNERIAAQNSAFLVAGVPTTSAGKQYRKGPGGGTAQGNWGNEDVTRWTSIPLRMAQASRKMQDRSVGNCFTFRIPAESKAEIRTQLEAQIGLESSTIYPDLYGLAEYLKRNAAIEFAETL